MVVEIKLGYAGAASLLANAYQVQIAEVYTSEWSVTMVLDEDDVKSRSFAAACQRQGLIYER